MNNKDLAKWVRPIIGDIEGVGVFVGNLFITAGHVVISGSQTVYFEGTGIPLRKEDAILLRTVREGETEEEAMDIAVFNFPAINSPLEIRSSDLYPSSIKCLSYKRFCEGEGVFRSYCCEPVAIKGSMTEPHGNFFVCKMNEEMTRGQSGSPLISEDNKLAGVVYAGEKIHDTKVAFCSIKPILAELQGYYMVR